MGENPKWFSSNVAGFVFLNRVYFSWDLLKNGLLGLNMGPVGKIGCCKSYVLVGLPKPVVAEKRLRVRGKSEAELG